MKRFSGEQKYEDLPQLPPSEPGYHPALQPYCHAQQGFRIKTGVTTWPVLSCPGPTPTFTTLKRILKSRFWCFVWRSLTWIKSKQGQVVQLVRTNGSLAYRKPFQQTLGSGLLSHRGLRLFPSQVMLPSFPEHEVLFGDQPPFKEPLA